MTITATHADRAITNSPIIGVLTQPFTALPKTADTTETAKSFIPNSHVKFLESAGARIVPVEYTLSQSKLHEMLEQVNGIYIPGDSA